MPKRRILWLVFAAALLAAGTGAAILKKPAAAPAPARAAALAEAPVLEFLATDVMLVEPRELRQTMPLSGSLRALQQAAVKARVGGEVREVLVREGEAVRAGQVLIRMDTADYQARLEQARGALLAARGQQDIAAKARDNNKALLDKGFISKNAFDTAASQFGIARANVESAQGALDLAQKALADTVVRAPISGLVSSRLVQPGEKVSVDHRLLDLVDLRQMEMEAAVPAADIMHIAPGQEVEVRIDGLPAPMLGTVVRINPATLAGSRSIMTYIRLDNPEGALRAGMFGEARLTLTKKAGVLSVPQTAVQNDGGRSYVYAIEAGKLAQKPVSLGLVGDDGNSAAVEILDGLANGAQIVRTNLGKLRTGSLVRFAQSGAATATADAPLRP